MQPFQTQAHRPELFLGLWLLDEADDAAGFIDLDDAAGRSLFPAHWQNGDSYVGLVVAVGFQKLAKIHAVKLVAAQNNDFAGAVLLNVANVLAHGVGRALIPVGRFIGLLRGQYLHKPAIEIVEFISVGDVPMQANA